MTAITIYQAPPPIERGWRLAGGGLAEHLSDDGGPRQVLAGWRSITLARIRRDALRDASP
jgi:hypothetical protein